MQNHQITCKHRRNNKGLLKLKERKEETKNKKKDGNEKRMSEVKINGVHHAYLFSQKLPWQRARLQQMAICHLAPSNLGKDLYFWCKTDLQMSLSYY